MFQHPKRLLVVVGALIGLAGGVLGFLLMTPEGQEAFFGPPGPSRSRGAVQGLVDRLKGQETYTVEHTDYRPEASALDQLMQDDTLASKPEAFDPELVHRIEVDGWRVNLSGAVIRLDVPMVRPDEDARLLTLHPSYQAAYRAAKQAGNSLEVYLPSVNLIDGLAKQFDDGLYAALDQAYYQGLGEALHGHVSLVRRLHDAVPPESPARPFLAAALELADVRVEGGDPAARQAQLRPFLGNPVLSKPIGFYTWNPTLEGCFRFLRFLQRPLKGADAAIGTDLAAALANDEALRADYVKAAHFYGTLTNPLKARTVDALLEPATGTDDDARPVALFPASASREGELFERLFPVGLPPGADLMRELITAIRSGQVDLTPRPDSGWYDYQVHALETLLLPEKGRESAKLLLTAGYKKRMLEAFKALMTKRRETHVRQLDIPLAAAAMPREQLKIRPRLRVEPALTYYLRTARAYAFLASFLDSEVGAETLQSLHGLTKGGPRPSDLRTELATMRDRFYGFYLFGCEDIGLAPEFLDGETVDRDHCETLATQWLKQPYDDADLATDTRVAVPIYYDPTRNVTRLWITLGVRMARLETSFARLPKIRSAEGDGSWEDVKPFQAEGQSYLIPVDEFAEVELNGPRVLTRDELRALCDQHKTKDAILKALRSQ